MGELNAVSGVVGATGTRLLVESDVYPKQVAARGLKFWRPNAAKSEEIDQIIMDEPVYGVARPEASLTIIASSRG